MKRMLVPVFFGLLAAAVSSGQEPSVLSIVSCSPGEASFSFEQSGVGIFTQTLIEALQGGADANRNSVVTIGELADYLRRSMRARTADFQNPSFTFKGQLSEFGFFSSMQRRTSIILCGIQDYQHLSGTGMGRADVDALSLSFKKALPNATIRTMVDQEARRPALMALLEQEIRSLEAGDYLIFYFSGEASEDRLLMNDSRLADSATTGIHVDELAALFASSRAHVCAFYEVQQHVSVPAY